MPKSRRSASGMDTTSWKKIPLKRSGSSYWSSLTTCLSRFAAGTFSLREVCWLRPCRQSMHQRGWRTASIKWLMSCAMPSPLHPSLPPSPPPLRRSTVTVRIMIIGLSLVNCGRLPHLTLLSALSEHHGRIHDSVRGLQPQCSFNDHTSDRSCTRTRCRRSCWWRR